MKTSTYMDRALRASDPRFSRILGKLGYRRSDLRTDVDTDLEAAELTALRSEYQDAAGKRAYHGWDAETLREKIAEAKAAD